MAITSLRIVDFRNLESIQLSPCHQGLNIITGSNGSGKTSILEAIHFLGHGRSFRTSTLAPLLRHAAEKFSVFSHIVTDSQRQVSIGAERTTSGSSRFKIADKDTTGVAELASLIPIRVINSHSHQLFESGPVFRRKYLDWGLFYQSESFFNVWRHYERALKQRNTILRNKRSKSELSPWTAELVKHGLELDKERRQYIRELQVHLVDVVKSLLPFDTVELSYLPGWDEASDLEAVLAGSSLEEYRAGHTLFGPHRADLDVMVAGVLAKQILSRGQQKLLICAMILAQGIMLAKYVNKGLIYLIDDLPSELDSDSREKLISLLINQQTQVFITAIERESISAAINNDLAAPVKVFHVEHGRVREV